MKRLHPPFSPLLHWSKPALLLSGFFLTLFIGFFDYITGYEIGFSAFYLVPLFFVTWFAGGKAGIAISFLNLLTLSAADYFSGKVFSHNLIELWNAFLLLSFYLTVAYLLNRLHEEFNRRESLIRDLESTRDTLKQRSEQLIKSNADLEQFAYIAAHDLRSPLIVIEGYLRRLQKKYGGNLDADAGGMIGQIRESTLKMHLLIDDLLTYARMGTTNPVFEMVNFNAVFKSVLLSLTSDIEEARARVDADSLPTVPADRTQASQLFQNLIGNAIKFRGTEPSRVQIAAREEGDEWIFSVRDNGIGIESGDRESIFTMFQRGHTPKRYPGTGIGLAICKRITERHGGRIWVESEPGEGATFFVALPKSQPRGNEEPDAGHSPL
ncbi:MAG: ATP-binding protein [Nitrospiraceae bacterium]|nr:ATP-binding protein [Nitrospiraceae bacterium]